MFRHLTPLIRWMRLETCLNWHTPVDRASVPVRLLLERDLGFCSVTPDEHRSQYIQQADFHGGLEPNPQCVTCNILNEGTAAYIDTSFPHDRRARTKILISFTWLVEEMPFINFFARDGRREYQQRGVSGRYEPSCPSPKYARSNLGSCRKAM